nr:uncharacterized protein LOC111505405 isoform X2 [Leptinotarsa decemlineata]
MSYKVTLLMLVCLGASLTAQKMQKKRQVDGIVSKEDDHVPAETGFGNPAAAVQTGSKFFQYIHRPAKDHVDHGHKRGNEHHFIERHEKERPHAGEFKTKVRWGDKHGGYGEHYWDYNHAGHGHDGDSGESQLNEEYAAYEDESKHVPVSARPENTLREKRQPALLEDVEFINDKAKSSILGGKVQKHGGNYRRVNDFRGKREQQKSFGKALVFDPDLGVIVDQDTGVEYKLSPIIK